MPDLIDDPRYSTYAERTKNITDLYKQAEVIALQKTTDEWMEVLAKRNVPCMRVHSLQSVLDDPQLCDTGFLEERDHPTEGRCLSVNNPVRFHETPAETFREPPLQGQDSTDILGELGYSAEEIDDLKLAGTFGD